MTAREFAKAFVATFKGEQRSPACRTALAEAMRELYNLSVLAAMVHYNHALAATKTEPDQRRFMIGSVVLA